MTDSFRTLSVGLSGDDVRALHARMLDLGAQVAHDELVEGFFGHSTWHELKSVQRRLNLAATGVADSDTVTALQDADAEHRGYVVGTVLGPDEKPVAKAVVQAIDRDLRSGQQLGEAASGEDGFYLVRYAPERARQLERGTADVYVRVLVRDKIVYDPPIEETIFNAPPLVSITVRLAVRVVPEQSEYERLVALIQPLLGEYDWSDLAEDGEYRDVTFLAGETGIDRDRISWVILANRVGRETDLAPYFFYALFAEGTLAAAQGWVSLTPRLHLTVSTPAGPLLNDIVLLPDADIESAVHDATATFLVPQRLADELPGILEDLHGRQEEARAWARDERQRVVRAHVAHLLQSDVSDQVNAVLEADPFGNLAGVLERLRGLQLVPNVVAADALGSLTLTDLLGDEPGLIGKVSERFGITGAGDAYRLAEVSAADWAAALDAPDAAAAQRAGQAMQARMAARYPTTAFAARLAADTQAPLPHAAAVADVLAAHPEFDLARGNVATLLAAHDQPVEPATASALRTVQRVFRLAPTYDHAAALLGSGISSSAALVRKGRQRFVRDAVQSGGFTPAEAMSAYHSAADIHTASLIVAEQLQGAAAATMLPAMAPAPATIEPVVKDFPNVKSLFATIDMWDCPDCRSVHGAAAYLVDVLQFLGERLVVDTTTSPAVTLKGARDVLFARRPDLAVTDLNCTNTNTTVPYLDVVCELLEDAVAPDASLPFIGAVAAGVISANLLAALQGAGLAFTDKAVVYGPDLDGAYVARDVTAVVGIAPDGANWRIRVLRHTFGTDDELAAAPQYVNATAYERLAASTWCFTLPFDLAHQETRRYFAQFDIDRADLMRRLQVGAVPSDAACAAEQLGLSDAQRALVVTPDPGNQPTIWNTPGALAAATLAVVDTFVTRAGITYQDLLGLLDLPWVDDGQDLFVQHLDSSADLAQKRIVNLDDTALDRIHRFIRARTATGWASATLDRAIRSTAGGAGSLDDACLVAFTTLSDAATLLSLTVDATLDILETLDIDDPDGTYAAAFLDPIRVGTVEAQFLPAAVHANEAAETATPGSGVKLSAVPASLGLALGTNPADTALLIAAAGGDPAITAASLSAVYGLSRLATALGLSVGEVTDLAALTAADPRASAAALVVFAQAATAMRASALPIGTWRYLMRHEAPDLLTALDLPAATVTALLGTLHASYDAARAADTMTIAADGTPTENTAAVRPFLARLPGITATTLAQMQTLLTDTWTDPAVSESAFVDAALGGLVDTNAIKAALATRAATPPPKDAAENAVIAAVADAVSGYLYRTDRQAALITAVATAFAVEEDVAQALLTGGRLKEPPPPVRRCCATSCSTTRPRPRPPTCSSEPLPCCISWSSPSASWG